MVYTFTAALLRSSDGGFVCGERLVSTTSEQQQTSSLWGTVAQLWGFRHEGITLNGKLNHLICSSYSNVPNNITSTRFSHQVWLPLHLKDDGERMRGFMSKRIMLPFHVDIYPLSKSIKKKHFWKLYRITVKLVLQRLCLDKPPELCDHLSLTLVFNFTKKNMHCWQSRALSFIFQWNWWCP